MVAEARVIVEECDREWRRQRNPRGRDQGPQPALDFLVYQHFNLNAEEIAAMPQGLVGDMRDTVRLAVHTGKDPLWVMRLLKRTRLENYLRERARRVLDPENLDGLGGDR